MSIEPGAAALSANIHSADGPASSEMPSDFVVDEKVLAQFPTGTKLLSSNTFGTSAWTITARLHVQNPDGSDEWFFLKTASNDHGKVLMEGEFNAMSELFKWAPDFVPRPHSFGKYAHENPATYFFLSEYVPMSDKMPDPQQLCTKLAKLHRESISPTGEFGFHTTTCQGRIPQSVGWERNWTTFFINLLQHVIDLDFKANGAWEELEFLEKRLVSDVIPRLLNALQENGNSIKPSLIHADLWEGNTGTSRQDGRIHVFDSAAFYAHNEMETGNWRCYYNKIANRIYTKTYLRNNPPSEPKSEWEDRNRLYSVYFNIIYSVNHENNGTAVRQLAYNDMYFLIDKYAPFSEGSGPPRLETSQMASLSAERDHTL